MQKRQVIIAFSGRKCAGKNTIANYVKQCYGDAFECSFADSLKEFCIDTLGLSREQCYGTDDQKNSLTEYEWENVNDYLRWKFGTREFRIALNSQVSNEIAGAFIPGKSIADNNLYDYYHRMVYEFNLEPVGLKHGFITAREVMQIFGTELIRSTFGNVWASATIRRIKKQGKLLSVITDNRFPNETEAVLREPEGHVIRLTRSPFGVEDRHSSESGLDDYDWNRARCHVLDNSKMSIDKQSKAVTPILEEIIGCQLTPNLDQEQ